MGIKKNMILLVMFFLMKTSSAQGACRRLVKSG
jgi:hypothetical protein